MTHMKTIDPQHKPCISLGLIGPSLSGKTTLLAQITQTQEIGDIKTPPLEISQEKDVLRLSLDTLKYEKLSTVKGKFTSFSTPKYHFIGVDTPGRKKYFKHLLRRISMMDLTLLVVDVSDETDLSKSLNDQIIACKVFGISKFIVCINKMENVEFSKDKFEKMKERMISIFKNHFLNENSMFIPISAITGENIFEKSSKMNNFYNGLCLVEILNELEPFKRDYQTPLRINTLDVVKIGGIGTVIIGRIESGILYPGMYLRNSNLIFEKIVKSIEKNLEHASCGLPGDIVGVNLKNISVREIHPGYVFGNAFDAFPREVDTFKANVKLLKTFKDGFTCAIHCHQSRVTCKVNILEKKDDLYLVEIFTERSKKCLFLENFSSNAKYGKFCMEISHKIIGFGKVLEVVHKDFPFSLSGVLTKLDSSLDRLKYDALNLMKMNLSEISKSFVMEAMKVNPFVYKYLPNNFRIDNDILSMDCFFNYPSLYVELPIEFKSDKETLLRYMKNHPFVIMFSSEKLRNDEEISTKMMEKSSMNVQFLSKKFSKQELLFEYIKNDLKILKYSLYDFFDVNFVKKLIYFFPMVIKHTPYLWGDEYLMKECILRNGLLIKFANKKWVTSGLILKAIDNKPTAFHFIDKIVNKTIALALLKKIPRSYSRLPLDLQMDEDVAYQVVSSDKKLISILPHGLQMIPKILLESYKGIPYKYYFYKVYFDTKLENNEEFLLKAIEIHEVIFKLFVSPSLKEDKDFIKKAMEANGNVFQFLNQKYKDNRDYIIIALKKDPSNIFYAKNSIYERDDQIIFMTFMGADLFNAHQFIEKTNIETNYSGNLSFIENLLVSRPLLFNYFSTIFTKEFRNKEFILKLMNIDIKLYEKLEEIFREDTEISMKYLRNVRNIQAKISERLLQNIDVQWASRKMFISISFVKNHEIHFKFQ
jgi:elongation factor 1-alpha